MSGKKVFTESKSIKRIKRRIHIFWFCVLSYICMLIITSKSLQYQLLIQPEIIFAALIITILLGRFTGLQLTEYIRFWPLIRRQVKEKIKPKKKKK